MRPKATTTGSNSVRYAYVPSVWATRAGAGSSPLTMHLVAGDCVTIKVTNSTKVARIGFHLTGLAGDTASSGVTAGFNGDSSIPDGTSRSFTYFVDNPRLSAGAIGAMSGTSVDKRGLYGMYDVAPAGSTFTDPMTGRAVDPVNSFPADFGESVDVHVPNGVSYRDFSLIMSDNEASLGASFMPYPANVGTPDDEVINYRRSAVDDSVAAAFTSATGDPATPVLRSYVGDKVVVNTLVAPGSEQMHAFNLGGREYLTDPRIPSSNRVATKGIGPWEVSTAVLNGTGADPTGDYFYGDRIRAYTEAGMWGLQRVLSPPTQCPQVGSGALQCLPQG